MKKSTKGIVLARSWSASAGGVSSRRGDWESSWLWFPRFSLAAVVAVGAGRGGVSVLEADTVPVSPSRKLTARSRRALNTTSARVP